MNNRLLNNAIRVRGRCSKRLMPIFLVTLLTLGFSACQPRDLQVSKNPFCQQPLNTNADCSFTLGEHQIWLSSSDSAMPIEEGVRLTLTSDVALGQIHSEIRGVSMYMGRLPVIWQQADDGLWHADVFLGACTDPDMVWELRLAITTDTEAQATSAQPYALQIRFQSHIPDR